MRIDSHLHIWERQPGHYQWLKPEFGAIYDDFPPSRVEPELAPSGVEGAVLVQADDSLDDARYMFNAARTHSWVLGVVAWVPLDDSARAEQVLDEWLGEPVFCGVRQLVHDDPRDNFYRLHEIEPTMRMLVNHAIPLDVPDAWPRDLRQVTDLASTHGDLTIVLDHMGKPPVDDGGLQSWRDELSRFARPGHTVVKFSGLHHPNRPYTREGVQFLWDTALDLFGPNRVMVGSDWPISENFGGYEPTWNVIDELVSTLSGDERAAVEWGTACRVYGRSERLAEVSERGRK